MVTCPFITFRVLLSLRKDTKKKSSKDVKTIDYFKTSDKFLNIYILFLRPKMFILLFQREFY